MIIIIITCWRYSATTDGVTLGSHLSGETKAPSGIDPIITKPPVANTKLPLAGDTTGKTTVGDGTAALKVPAPTGGVIAKPTGEAAGGSTATKEVLLIPGGAGDTKPKGTTAEP